MPELTTTIQTWFPEFTWDIRKINWRNPYNLLIVFLLLLNILPILAPFFMYWGWDAAAKVIYFFYSFTCHQFAHRSLHIHDHQCAWCSRDMAIWGAMLGVAVVVKLRKLEGGLPWYWLAPFIIPIALDGGIQTIATVLGINPATGADSALYISNNLLRAITGGWFGIGMGLFIFPPMFRSFTRGDDGSKPKKRLDRWRLLRYVLFVLILGFASYLAMVVFWRISSNRVEPANIFDLQVKTPTSKEFFLRRETGSCPTNAIGADPLALECFFGFN